MWLLWVAAIPPRKRVLGTAIALATEDTGRHPSATMLAKRTSTPSNARTRSDLTVTRT